MRLLILCAFVIAFQPFVDAQPAPIDLERVVATAWGQIDDLHSAWAEDAMGVHHSAPFVNSLIRRLAPGIGGFNYVDECTIKNDGYATLPTDPGRNLHHAILMGAFLHGKEVRLTLKGCSYDHPRIIGVEVR